MVKYAEDTQFFLFYILLFGISYNDIISDAETFLINMNERVGIMSINSHFLFSMTRYRRL